MARGVPGGLDLYISCSLFGACPKSKKRISIVLFSCTKENPSLSHESSDIRTGNSPTQTPHRVAYRKRGIEEKGEVEDERDNATER